MQGGPGVLDGDLHHRAVLRTAPNRLVTLTGLEGGMSHDAYLAAPSGARPDKGGL